MKSTIGLVLRLNSAGLTNIGRAMRSHKRTLSIQSAIVQGKLRSPSEAKQLPLKSKMIMSKVSAVSTTCWTIWTELSKLKAIPKTKRCACGTSWQLLTLKNTSLKRKTTKSFKRKRTRNSETYTMFRESLDNRKKTLKRKNLWKKTRFLDINSSFWRSMSKSTSRKSSTGTSSRPTTTSTHLSIQSLFRRSMTKSDNKLPNLPSWKNKLCWINSSRSEKTTTKSSKTSSCRNKWTSWITETLQSRSMITSTWPARFRN